MQHHFFLAQIMSNSDVLVQYYQYITKMLKNGSYNVVTSLLKYNNVATC